MAADNIHMLLGNHEQMCLDTLGPNSVYGSRDLWRQNGGNCTYRHLLYISSARERWEILRFIAGLPDHLEVTVGDRIFHLVHGMPSEDPHRRIWDRPVPDCIAPFPDRTTIVGHTPTCFLTGRMDEILSIWHGDGIIDIDQVAATPANTGGWPVCGWTIWPSSTYKIERDRQLKRCLSPFSVIFGRSPL